MFNKHKRNMIKNNEKKGLLKIVLFMYVLFPFRINFMASIQAYSLYALETVLLCLFLSELYYNNLQKKVIYPLLCFLLLFLLLSFMAFFLPIIMNTGDMTYFVRYFTFFKKMIAILGIAHLCEDLGDFVKLFLITTTIYVICTVILLIPSFHSAYSNIVMIQEDSQSSVHMQSARYYTRFGLQGLSGLGWSFRCAFSVGLCCCDYILKKFKLSNHEIIVYGAMNLLGTIFYARTGTIVAFACIIFTACYQLVIHRRTYLFISLSLIALVCLVIFLCNIEYIQENPSLSWIFEGVISLVQTGKFETASSTYIIDKMFVKIPMDTFFFGDARYSTSSGLYYMGTDLGIIRPLLFWGIGGQIIYYVMPLTLLFPIKKCLNSKDSNFFFGIMALILIGFELKGECNFEFCTVLLGMYLALIRGTFSKKICLKIKKGYRYIENKHSKMMEGSI